MSKGALLWALGVDLDYWTFSFLADATQIQSQI